MTVDNERNPMADQSYDISSHKYGVITSFFTAVIENESNDLSLKIEAAEAWDTMEEEESYDPAISFLRSRFSHTFKPDE